MQKKQFAKCELYSKKELRAAILRYKMVNCSLRLASFFFLQNTRNTKQ